MYHRMSTLPAGPERPKSRKWLIPAIGYSVSIASLIWVYWGFDWKTELPKFARAHWGWVAVAVAADIAVYCFQGWRWSLLLRPLRPVRWLQSVQAIFIGLLANEVLPLRTGELIRGYVQSLWTRIPFSVVISSIAVERLFDGIILVLGFYLMSLFVELPALIRDVSLTLALVVGAVAVVLVIVMFHKHHAHAAVKHSRWSEALWHVVEGLHSMGNSRWFYAAAAVSVIYLGLQVVPIYSLVLAYQMDLSLGAAAVVLVILRIGTVIPQAPGNVGGFQFFAVLGLMLFGVDKADATSFATIMFLVVTIPLWFGGAVAAALAGVRIKDLQQQAAASVPSATVSGRQ